MQSWLNVVILLFLSMETFVNDVTVPFCCHFVALGNRVLLHSHIYRTQCYVSSETSDRTQCYTVDELCFLLHICFCWVSLWWPGGCIMNLWFYWLILLKIFLCPRPLWRHKKQELISSVTKLSSREEEVRVHDFVVPLCRCFSSSLLLYDGNLYSF